MENRFRSKVFAYVFLYGLWWCSKIYISQGSVATQLWCGGIFNNRCVANFSQSVAVKEISKSVNIWRMYWQKLVGTFLWPTVYKHWLKRGFHPTQRTQRKERNEMTSLLHRPITAASDDGVCRWHAARLWQTRAKLLKLNLTCIISCTTSKKRTKICTIDYFLNFYTWKT